MRPWVEKSPSGSAVEGPTGMLISIFMPRSTAKRVAKAAPPRQRFSLEVCSSNHSPARSVPRTDIGSLTATRRSLRRSRLGVVRSESCATAAEIFAGGLFLEPLAGAVGATHRHREFNRYTAFPTAFETGGGRASRCHSVPPCLLVDGLQEQHLSVRGDGIGKKRIHAVQNFSGGVGRVNVPAQFAAVTNSVGKPARKLFHLADRVGPLGLHQIAEVRGKQGIPI